MKPKLSSRRIAQPEGQVARAVNTSIMESDFERILELTRCISAQAHKSTSCVQKHREVLKSRGETDGRLSDLARWRVSPEFSSRERAAFRLAESISLKRSKEDATRALKETRKLFSPDEMLGLSLAIMAITDWLELHSEPHIRVLVVEDNQADQELLQLQLRKSQLHENVIFMSDADQALELIQGYRKGEFEWELIAIFLDIHLTGMSGIELLQFLRNILGMDDLHVIMMTSSNDPKEIEECHNLKVAGFIQKPVTYSSFSNAVANIFHQPLQSRSFLGRVE